MMKQVFLLAGLLALPISNVAFANWIGDFFKEDAKRFERYYQEFKSDYKDSKIEIYLNSYIGTVVYFDFDNSKDSYIRLRLRGGSELTFGIVKETVIDGIKSLKDINKGDDILVYTLTLWHGTQVDGGGMTYARKIKVYKKQ